MSPVRTLAQVINCADTDQRGSPRTDAAGCDAGAIETGDVIFTDSFE